MSRPLVSVGVPVFNGERYLAAALESIVGQTFTDIEIIVSDNASTDATPDICADFARRDSRVRLSRNDRNLGAAPNFNRCFELATGEYFKWAAADDLCDKEFLASCLELLRADPGMVLCHSETLVIDASDHPVEQHGHYHNLLLGADSDDPAERFRSLVLSQHYCFDVFGLIRSSVLRRTPRIASYVASDRNLLAELGLLGRFGRVPRPLFFSREHPERSIRALPTLSSRARWFDPRLGPSPRPLWRQIFEYTRSVLRVPLPLRARIECLGTVARMARWSWPTLRAELLPERPADGD